MTKTFGYLPVGSTLHSAEALEQVVAGFAPALEGIGGGRSDMAALNEPGALFFFVLTGGTEQHVLRLWRQRATDFGQAPLWLVAHPTQNSLPAALEVMARIKQEGASGRLFYLDSASDEEGLQQVAAAAADYGPWQALRDAKIGLIGEPSDWLVASSPTPSVVRNAWGPEVLSIAIGELLDTCEQIDTAQLEVLSRELLAGAREMQGLLPADIEAALRLTLALRTLVAERSLSAVALRCFDLLGDHKVSGCIALSDLNDQGIVAACEADLPCAIGMLWTRLLLGLPSWMANPSRIDRAKNSLWLAHCTIARSMVECYSLRSHFESGVGVGLQGTLEKGPVTLLRVGGKDLRRLWIGQGEIVDGAGNLADLCRTQVEVRFDDYKVEDLLRQPLGNHLVLIKGHHAARLLGWWESMVRGYV